MDTKVQKEKISQIKEYLSKADIGSAIKVLNEILKDDPRVKDLIVQSFRKSNIEKNFNNGIIDFKTASLEENAIVKALLDLVDDIEKYNISLGNAVIFINDLKHAKAREFTFLLMGRTGVGKSSTINSLMGYPIAKVGDYTPTTMEVEEHRLPIEGANFLVVDTPGLCDDLPDKGNDQKYMQLVREKIKNMDCLLYVTQLDEPRVRSDEKYGIQLMTKTFTENIWKNSVIVFTYADRIENVQKFREALRERTRLLKEAITDSGVSTDISLEIPSVAISNTKEFTPDGERWLGELYTTVVERVSKEGFAQFVLANMPRVEYTNNSSNSRSQSTSHNSSSGYYDYNDNRPQKQITKVYVSEKQVERQNKAAEKNGFWDKVGKGIESVGKSIGKAVDKFAKWLLG